MSDSEIQTYQDIINSFLFMVKKTVKLEKFHLMKRRKQCVLLFPLLEAAKTLLYDYYKKYLTQMLDIHSDCYLKEFIESIDN